MKENSHVFFVAFPYPEGHSSTESINDTVGVVESSFSNSVFQDDTVPEFRISRIRNDTSGHDIASTNFSSEIPRKYWHEHTTLGPRTGSMTCPNCLLPIETIVRYNEIRLTHMAAACLFPIGLCALPYCTPYFRDAEHYCPMCNVYLGTSFAQGWESIKCCSTKTTQS